MGTLKRLRALRATLIDPAIDEHSGRIVQTGGENRAEVWGRPAALAVAKDGFLLVADDTGRTIWRISYTGTR